MTGRRSKGYVAAADLLRVFAVGLVACFHIWQQSWFDPGFHLLGVHFDLQRIICRGYMGVDLMLLLSGFLLYLPVARAGRMPRTGKFYARRAWRILPSYLFALAVCVVFTFLYGREIGSAPLWKDLLTHLTFTHTFTRPTYLWSSLNVALWTLAVEVQFYLLFPLLGRAFLRRPLVTATAMTALALGYRLAITPREDVTILFNQLPAMLDLYACGMLAANFLASREGRGHWLYGAGSLVCLGAIVWILWAQNPATPRDLNQWQMASRLPLGLLGGAFLWCGGQWTRALERIIGNPLTKWCAAISYNFYIWHQYLAVKLKLWHIPPYSAEPPQMYEGRAWQALYTLICFAVAFAAAAAVTYTIEQPAYRLRRLVRRRAAAPTNVR